jgi:hypothetical protein
LLIIAVVLQRGIAAITSVTTAQCTCMNVTDAVGYSNALLLNLSDNLLKLSSI